MDNNRKEIINTLTVDELESAIYGENGLYEKVIDKINELNNEEPRQASKILDKSTQAIRDFKCRISNTETKRTGFLKIAEYARMVGVS